MAKWFHATSECKVDFRAIIIMSNQVLPNGPVTRDDLFMAVRRLPRWQIPALENPAITGPLGGGIGVDRNLLFFGRGVKHGESDIVRKPAMIEKQKPFHFNVENPMLDNRFSYRELGLSSNRRRRIPRIYEIPNASASLESNYRAIVSSIKGSPMRPAWRVLDDDQEFRGYYGHSPNFHPHLPGFCELDVDRVFKGPVKQTESSIDRLPERMARAFIRLYQNQLDEDDPPPSPARRVYLEGQIELLEDYIQQLQSN